MTGVQPNPYVGPRTFKEEERNLFFGRDREALDLVSLVVSERLVLFYAQSGAGKSSLVNTKLIPALREEEGYKILPVGRVGGAESTAAAGAQVHNIYMYNLLNSLLKDHNRRDSLSKLRFTEFLHQFLEKDEDGDQRHVLIIDQFEEIFSMYPEEWEKRKDFFMELAQAMKEFHRLWIVLVMREDYIANLDPYVYLLPGKLRVRYYMQRLERDGALKAVQEPVKKLRPFAQDVAETLVENLAGIKVQRPDEHMEMRPGQFIEPLQLQVVCQYLWEHLPPGSEITFEDLRLIGDVDKILVKYYDARVSKVAQEKQISQRLIRKWFEEKLITNGGLRNMILKGQGETGGLDNTVIEAFLGDLLRAEWRGGAVFYEITHDRLVEPIRTGNKMWFNENLSPLQMQASLWSHHKKNESWLWIEQALLEAEDWAHYNSHELTELDAEFLAASRKYHEEIMARRALAAKLRIYSWGITIFAVLLLIAGSYAFYQWLNTQQIAAQDLINSAAQLHDRGMYAESISKFLLAQGLDEAVVETIDDDAILMNLCVDGSLFSDDPANVKNACERAVRLSPENGNIRDKRGINRLLLGDRQGAIEDFEIAVSWYEKQKSDEGAYLRAQLRQDWINQLTSGKDPLAQEETFNALRAQSFIASVAHLNSVPLYEEMISRFVEAKRLDPNVVSTIQDDGVLNNVCWWGSLYRKARIVKDACERAVELAPADGGIIDSRGLNRALLDNYPGAITDFEAAVKWFVTNNEDETLIEKRRAWIVALKNNQNPFDRATLEELKYE